jgi:hypothetical protein
MQERLEATRWGRILISVVLILILFSVITANLYPSDLKRQLFHVAKPVIYVTGLDQGWDVFSPNVRQQSVQLVARIEYADGTVQDWKIPKGGSLFGAYWDYRWRKWVELMVLGFEPDELQKAARWIADRHTAAGREPVTVQLVERYSQLTTPGTKPSHGPWLSRPFYTFDVRKGRAE